MKLSENEYWAVLHVYDKMLAVCGYYGMVSHAVPLPESLHAVLTLDRTFVVCIIYIFK